MKLPGNADISEAKLIRYLLVKRMIGDKSNFLRKGGYTLDNWQHLERDLRVQILPQDAIAIEKTVYGELFEIRAPLTGPNGMTQNVKTIWIVEAGHDTTKFVTLYPDRKRRGP